MGNDKTLVFPGTLGNLSEVWLYRQLTAMERYQPHVLVLDYLNRQQFPFENLWFLDSSNVLVHHSYQLEALVAGRSFMNTATLRSWRLARFFKKIEPKLIHCHFLWNARDLLHLLPPVTIPFVVTAHGSDVNFARVNDQYRESIQVVLERADCVIAVSEFIAEKLCELGCSRNKIRKIYLGAPLVTARRPRSSVSDVTNVLSIGSLKAVKGHRYLIEAFSIALKIETGLRLTIVGEGEERKALEIQIGALGLENHVKLKGEVSPPGVQAVLNQTDIYAQHCVKEVASQEGFGDILREEALGISLVEAASAGIPIIATRSGGVGEICRDGENGFLVEPLDTTMMAQKLVELVKNQKLRSEFGENGRRIVESEFELVNQTQKVERLYDELISNVGDGGGDAQ